MGSRYWGVSKWLSCLLMLQPCFAAHAGTVTYVYTDPQGTPLAEADAQGNITARFDYTPYGSVAMGSAPNGPGYTGHVNDADTGLVYMQARYYDPVVARFLSVDPKAPAAGNAFNFNRYTYANNNPINNIDPDGRNCTRTGDSVTCVPTMNGTVLTQLPSFTLPATKNWPATMDSSSSGHHEYIYSTPIGNRSPASVAQADANDPTPNDHDRPGTPQGTSNSAAPSSGLRGLLAAASAALPSFLGGGDSQVTTYTFNDSKGALWTVNMTQDSHTLSPGYVLRGVSQGDNISYGEGTAWKQNLGRASEVLMNDAFEGQTKKNVDEVH
ncbi:MAG: RHS repeat-associated core domain-containing protein [Rhodanobacter sp.]